VAGGAGGHICVCWMMVQFAPAVAALVA
jgi:hypothetical protein